MTPKRWQQLKPLYAAAVDLPQPERAHFVARHCAHNPELQAQLEELLHASDQPSDSRFDPLINFRSLLPEPPATLAEGVILLGRFKIVRLLGSGGMGDVYEANDLLLEPGQIALKTIRSECPGDFDLLARFRKEVQLARKVSNPHVCRIHEFFLTDSSSSQPSLAFLTMELLSGTTLADKISFSGPMPWREARIIALQICDALQAIHEAGIIHRDLKGRNVMLTTRNGASSAVLMDFGIAQELFRLGADQSTALTRNGGAIGTPAYMAPEQFKGSEVTPATDVYAFGILLYELLTGKLPLSAESQAKDAIARKKFTVRASAIQPGIPRHIDEIISMCLEYDPKRRYQSAMEVEQALRTNAIFLHLRQRPYDFLGGVAALIIALFLLLQIPVIGERVKGMLFSSPEKHIAVLPLEYGKEDPPSQAVGDGLMDSLTGRLSNLGVDNKMLWVVPASEVRARHVSDSAAALREFGATLVVRGSFERNDRLSRLRLTLIDSRKTREIGFVDVEAQSGDLVDLQDEAVTRLSRLMNIGKDKIVRNGERGTRAAYEDYLAGLGYFNRLDRPGNLDLSIHSFHSAIRTDPKFSIAYARLGEAYLMQFRLEANTQSIQAAEQYIRKAMELDSEVPSTFVALAHLHQLSGQHDLALHEFQRALTLDPRDPEALQGMASSYKHLGRNREAEAAYLKAAALRPNDWKGYNDLGNFLEEIGRPSEAVAQYKHALDLAPNNSWVYTNLGMTYIDFDDPRMLEAAEAALKRSIAIDPSFVALYDLGFLYSVRHQFTEAIAANKAALNLNQKSFDAWYNLSEAYEWLRQDQEADFARKKAMEILESRVKHNQEDAEAQATLGSIYAKYKERSKARDKIDISLALAPDNQYVCSQVADAYELLGRRREAITYVKRAVSLGLNWRQLDGDPEIQGVLMEMRHPEKHS